MYWLLSFVLGFDHWNWRGLVKKIVSNMITLRWLWIGISVDPKHSVHCINGEICFTVRLGGISWFSYTGGCQDQTQLMDDRNTEFKNHFVFWKKKKSILHSIEIRFFVEATSHCGSYQWQFYFPKFWLFIPSSGQISTLMTLTVVFIQEYLQLHLWFSISSCVGAEVVVANPWILHTFISYPLIAHLCESFDLYHW